MALPNTRAERIDALMAISEQIYPILEQNIGIEIRARKIVRRSFALVATALHTGSTPSQAGALFEGYLAHELRTVDYGLYARYCAPAQQPSRITVPAAIAELANRYADVLRSTMLADHSFEPDAIHALHLAALAVPYARAHYPELDAHKVALYCLIHDLPEAYVGDTPTFNISDAKLEAKRQAEAEALATFQRDYGDEWPELVRLVHDYEDLVDDEAAFVKSMDKNDPGYTHFRNNAHALKTQHNMKSAKQFKAQADSNIERTLPYASRFHLVLDDKYELTERIATYIEL